MAQDTSAVDALVAADHQSIIGVLGALEARLGDAESELEQLVRELSVHVAAEEQVLYPRVVTEVRGAEMLVELSLEDHYALKAILTELDGADPERARTRTKLDDLRAIVREHFREEEEVLLPALRRAVGPPTMVEVGDAFARAKDIAPTRPHPHLARRPPGNILVGALEGLIDRARDFVGGRRRP